MIDHPFELVAFSILGGMTMAILLVTMAEVLGLTPEEDDDEM